MKKKKSLLLFLAATSASFVQAALPVHTSFAAGIENVQEKRSYLYKRKSD